MKCCVVANEKAEHQRSWGGAFAEGMRRHGWEVEIGRDVSGNYDMLVQWGVRNQMRIAQARNDGAKVVILERGYLGDRMRKYTSVSLGGGLNGRATFGPCQDDGQRFRSIARLEPWQDSKRAIILGQCPGDMSVKGMNLSEIYTNAASRCRDLGWSVDYRPHPLRPAPVQGVRNVDHTIPITEALKGYGMAITINSNSGVDALLAGVPTVALDEGSMAWEVAAHEIGVAKKPREKWAHHLAWKQWTREEIERGDAWAALA